MDGMNDRRTCPKCKAAPAAEENGGPCVACMQQQMDDVTLSLGVQKAERPPAMPEIRCFGNYELLLQIARGGMGIVYKARQVSLNRIVAVKTILAGQFADEETLKRFLNEAEAAANLQHPNIVAIHEVGEQDGQHYFSMDFVEGRNLAQITCGKPLPPARAAKYARKIAQAIHYAHQRGTLHRDLKPSNILIDEDDEPRITDFGLAKIANRDTGLTRHGFVLGTPSYMPPEQATSRLDLIGPQSDVYSIGAILFELLTGRPPFKTDNLQATLLKVAQDPPPIPRKLNPGVPVELETICLKCLEKSPQQRYATARDLADDLGRFLNHEPILARPASATRKVEQWMRRHTWALAAAGVLLFASMACLTYGLWEQNRYLLWSAAHPGHIREAGLRTKEYEAADLAAIVVNIALIGVFAWLTGRMRKQKLQYNAQSGTRPIAFSLSPTSQIWAALLGVFGVIYALYLLGKAIDAFVWDAYTGYGPVAISVYSTLYFGVLLLLLVLRERHRTLFGSDFFTPGEPPHEVTARVIDSLRDRDPLLAYKIYRDAMQCRAAESKAAVELIASANGLAVPPALISRARLWVGLALTVLAACAAYLLMPVAWRTALLLQVAGGWVMGVAIMIASRFSKSWRHVLAFLPGMLLLRRALAVLLGFLIMLVAGEYQRHAYPDFSRLEGFTLGIFAGIALIVSSYKKAS